MRTLTVIGLLVLATALGWAPAALGAPECDPILKERSPQAVLFDFRAALALQDWPAVRCNFTDDAVMISDSGVSTGVNAIVAEFQALSAFFGGSFVQVYSEIIVTIPSGYNRFMARVLYTVDTTCSDILDGIDTYVMKGGKIVSLTTHGFIDFAC